MQQSGHRSRTVLPDALPAHSTPPAIPSPPLPRNARTPPSTAADAPPPGSSPDESTSSSDCQVATPRHRPPCPLVEQHVGSRLVANPVRRSRRRPGPGRAPAVPPPPSNDARRCRRPPASPAARASRLERPVVAEMTVQQVDVFVHPPRHVGVHGGLELEQDEPAIDPRQSALSRRPNPNASRFSAIAASSRAPSACCARSSATSRVIFASKGSPSSACGSAPT